MNIFHSTLDIDFIGPKNGFLYLSKYILFNAKQDYKFHYAAKG